MLTSSDLTARRPGATTVAGAAGLFPVPASAGPSVVRRPNFVGRFTQVTGRIASDDFNEDGKLDLVGLRGQRISIIFGNGDGTLSPGISVPAPYTDTGLIAANLNGDGHTDLVEPRQLSNISVFLGNGDGTFQSPGVYATGVQPGRPVLLDANSDGKWDVAVACTGQGPDFPVLLFLGNGDGTLQPARTIATGGTWFPMATGDLNADGKADLIYGSGGAGYNVILGNGDGTFANPTSYRVGATIRQIMVADANGDGKLDVFTPDLNDGTISLLLGNGDGTLQARQTIPSASPFGLVAADLNRDGKLDLAVTNGDPTYTVSVLWGNGNGTFQAAQSYTDDRFPVGIVAADFDGDGRLDLATANSFGTNVTVLRGTGGPLVDGRTW